MPARSRVIPAVDYRRTRWANGAGWTREIHAQGEGDWDWRLSIAEVSAPAPFSRFDGVDRELVLLSGAGIALAFDDGEAVEICPPHGRHRFAGERALSGCPIDGPTQDFNLMWRRDRIEADLWHRPLVGAMVVFAEPHSTWVVHLMAGHARFTDASGLPDLMAGDTAILVAGDTRLRHALDGAGEALLMRLTPRGTPPATGDVLRLVDPR